MNAERWQQVKQLLNQAIAYDPAERSSYLERECGTDTQLRSEVESLLSSHERAGSGFMRGPAMHARPSAAVAAAPARDRRIGPYQLLEEIGHGGMGEVFRAIRADGQYKKEVAIKFVRGGFASSFVLERFRNERQILASLDHPNIARLLDGGTTDDAVPYLVMDLIEGASIDHYCDDHSLSITERLQLFRQVCDAVQYAHQRMVIHRDIKPSNILVTKEGVPKLLDFGIAKLLDPSASAGNTWARPMTPEYASPEQVRGEFVTAGSDIYSLGVVFYELLTGHSPYRGDTSTPHELARAICDEDPLRPSAAILKTSKKRTQDPSSQTSIRSLREGSASKLCRRLKGDLDNIALKALRKDPSLRYASVERFSDDLRRYREGLPVTARGYSWSYRVGKFAKRHKLGLASATLIAAALLIGGVMTLREARIAAANAQRAEKRFSDVRQLANSLLFDIHDAIAFLPGATPARKLLVTKALIYLDTLAEEARGDTSLQKELAAAYLRLGDVQGYPTESNLGDTAAALQTYQKALKIIEPLCSSRTRDSQACELEATVRFHLAVIFLQTSDKEGALRHASKGLALSQDSFAASASDAQAHRDIAAGYELVGDVLVDLNRFDEVEENYRKAEEIFFDLERANPTSSTEVRNLSLIEKKEGGILEATGRPQEALEHYRKALAIDESLARKNPDNGLLRSDLSISYSNVGDILLRKGAFSESLKYYREALAINESLVAADPNDSKARHYLALTEEEVGRVLLRSGHAAASVEHFRKALMVTENLLATAPEGVQLWSDVAAYSCRLGDAAAEIAAHAGVDSRLRNWREAKVWYEKSANAWTELRKHGTPSPRDDGITPENTTEGLARCNAALQHLVPGGSN